jgi:hypothetical protein
MPGNLKQISGTIAYAAENNVPQLSISPLLTSSPQSALTVHPKVMNELWQVLPQFIEQAQNAGVKLRFSDEFSMLGPWEERLAEAGIEILAPKAPVHLIRIDASGRLETLETMREGGTTGLQVPESLAEADAFAGQIAELCTGRAAVAA